MANIYVRSTDGNDADNGSTWALAKATLGGALAIASAGDTIYVSQAHAESTSSALTITVGTKASPLKIICGNDSAEPPTAVATTATVTTSSSTVSISSHCYIYGVTIKTTYGGTANIQFAGIADMACEQVTLEASSGNPGGVNAVTSNSANCRLMLKNCNFKFGTNQSITTNMSLFVQGGSYVSAAGSMTNLVTLGSGGRNGTVLFEGFDLSNMAATVALCNISTGSGVITFRNCKLPASWSGNLVTGSINPGTRAEMYNCDNADTNYRVWIEDYYGTIKHETTLIKTGGASDGTTGLSWKMTSGADAEYPHQTLKSPEIVRWNDTTASAITVTVDVLHDSATNLTDGEVWLEVQYLGTSGVPLGSFISDAKADVLATASDQTASSATWTTTGLTNPNKQKLSVTFTPQEKGFIHAVVHLAKASKTIYVDPLLTIS